MTPAKSSPLSIRVIMAWTSNASNRAEARDAPMRSAKRRSGCHSIRTLPMSKMTALMVMRLPSARVFGRQGAALGGLAPDEIEARANDERDADPCGGGGPCAEDGDAPHDRHRHGDKFEGRGEGGLGQPVGLRDEKTAEHAGHPQHGEDRPILGRDGPPRAQQEFQ